MGISTIRRFAVTRFGATSVLLAGATIGLASLAIASVVSNESSTAPGQEVLGGLESPQSVNISSYRIPLSADEQPAVWVKDHDIVASVVIEEEGEPTWSAVDPEAASEGLVRDRYIYTPLTATVKEYMKGSGPETIKLVREGGTIGDVTVVFSDVADLKAGDEAVVFLSSPGLLYDGYNVGNAYVINGDTAWSELDQRRISTSELLPQLREAAALEAGTD